MFLDSILHCVTPQVEAARARPFGSTLYYIGPASQDTAAAILAGRQDGAFVLRASLRQPDSYALGVRLGGAVHHVSVSHDAVGLRSSCPVHYRYCLRL